MMATHRHLENPQMSLTIETTEANNARGACSLRRMQEDAPRAGVPGAPAAAQAGAPAAASAEQQPLPAPPVSSTAVRADSSTPSEPALLPLGGTSLEG